MSIISRHSTRDNSTKAKGHQDRRVALIVSTMRSGSTLLKALLAVAPDISDLPETDFQQYAKSGKENEIFSLCSDPIIVLKRPAWFNEISTYPKLPEIPNLKKIVLIRDAYENVASLRNMVLRNFPFELKPFGNTFLAEKYWLKINERLVQMAEGDPKNTQLIHYKDLLQTPKKITQQLFSFLGSAQKEGIDQYQKPTGYKWKWGQDDGGEKIKTLKVLKPQTPKFDNPYLVNTLKKSKGIKYLCEKLGYNSF